MIWIVFFVNLNLILEANTGEQLYGIPVVTSNYVNMFRTSVGDLQEPLFPCVEQGNCMYTATTLWIVFMSEIYFMTIILNNFLIAKVS